MATCSRSLNRWFLLTALGTGGTEILLLSVMTNQMALDDSGVMSALVYTCSLAAVSLMGIIGGAVLQAHTNRSIGLFSGLSCALLCLFAIAASSTWSGFALTGLISFFGALNGPNVTATFALLLGSNRAAGMARYQSASIATAVASPMLGALMISAGQTKWALILASLLHLASVAPWLMISSQRNSVHTGSGGFWDSALTGYRCILETRALGLMTLARVLNNVLYIGLPISLPLIIGTLKLDNTDAAWTQASAVSAIRIAALCSGTALTYFLSKYASLARSLPMQTLGCGLAAVATLCVADEPSMIVTACAIAGLGQFAFRLSGTTFGPAVTPAGELAQVILAGDTLVRLFSATYGLGLVALAGITGHPAYTLLFLSAFALPAPKLMRPAVEKHYEIMRKDQFEAVKSCEAVEKGR